MSGAPERKKDRIPDPTPDMVEAGAAELADYVSADVGPALREEVAAAVYEAMRAKAR